MRFGRRDIGFTGSLAGGSILPLPRTGDWASVRAEPRTGIYIKSASLHEPGEPPACQRIAFYGLPPPARRPDPWRTIDWRTLAWRARARRIDCSFPGRAERRRLRPGFGSGRRPRQWRRYPPERPRLRRGRNRLQHAADAAGAEARLPHHLSRRRRSCCRRPPSSRSSATATTSSTGSASSATEC